MDLYDDHEYWRCEDDAIMEEVDPEEEDSEEDPEEKDLEEDPEEEDPEEDPEEGVRMGETSAEDSKDESFTDSNTTLLKRFQYIVFWGKGVFACIFRTLGRFCMFVKEMRENDVS